MRGKEVVYFRIVNFLQKYFSQILQVKILEKCIFIENFLILEYFI